MNDPPSRLLTTLLLPVALVWDAGRELWRAWGWVGRGLDRVMAGMFWPFERAADAMAWTLRTAGRVLRVAAITAWLSRTIDRLLAPVERVLRLLGTRIWRAIHAAAHAIADMLAPVVRPVARAASAVGRVVSRAARLAIERARRAARAILRALEPAHRALRAAIQRVRRRRR